MKIRIKDGSKEIVVEENVNSVSDCATAVIVAEKFSFRSRDNLLDTISKLCTEMKKLKDADL